MLIQSQDGDFIVNTNTLVSLYRDGCYIRCVTDYDSNSFGYTMGKCASEENAQNVINSILDAVVNGAEVVKFCEKDTEE